MPPSSSALLRHQPIGPSTLTRSVALAGTAALPCADSRWSARAGRLPDFSNAVEGFATTIGEQITAGVGDIVQFFGVNASLDIRVESTRDSNLDTAALARSPPCTLAALRSVFDVWGQTLGDFIDETVSDVFSLVPTNNIAAAYAASYAANMPSYRRRPRAWGGARAKALLALRGSTVQAGAGMGFGLQLYCNCRVLLSTGLGGGGGFTVHINARDLRAPRGRLPGDYEFSGGLGGGGGTQLLVRGSVAARNGSAAARNGCVPAFDMSIGGGGGGDLDGLDQGASADPDERVPPGLRTTGQLRDMVRRKLATCSFVTATGGGGGGAGFTVQGRMNASYGGGVDVSIRLGSRAATSRFERACSRSEGGDGGGSGGGGGGQPSADYSKMSPYLEACRNRCLTQAAADFWTGCNCPCTKGVFRRFNLSFADNIQC